MSNSSSPAVPAAPVVPAVPLVYDQDGLQSVHDHDFMADPRFVAAYQRGVQAVGRDYRWHWRVHVGLWAADVASRLPGDFVECGVNRGFLASAIMQYLDWNRRGRMFYLLDTFKGLDERYITSEERDSGILKKNQELIDLGWYVVGVDSVRQNFAEWQNVAIIEGTIPHTLPQITTERIAFLHLDLNCAPPEVAALHFCWPRLVPGAVVLLDDYAFRGYKPQKLAMDAVAQELGVSIVSLPTGQGLLIKS